MDAGLPVIPAAVPLGVVMAAAVPIVIVVWYLYGGRFGVYGLGLFIRILQRRIMYFVWCCNRRKTVPLYTLKPYGDTHAPRPQTNTRSSILARELCISDSPCTSGYLMPNGQWLAAVSLCSEELPIIR